MLLLDLAQVVRENPIWGLDGLVDMQRFGVSGIRVPVDWMAWSASKS